MKCKIIILFTPETADEVIETRLLKIKGYAKTYNVNNIGKQRLIYPVRQENTPWYLKKGAWFYYAKKVEMSIEVSKYRLERIKELLKNDDVIKVTVVRTGDR